MSGFTLAVFYWSALYWSAAAGLIVVHEAGHYLAGRLAGVPAHAARIRLLALPQHVALKDDGGWISPLSYERYVAAAERYLPTPGRAFAFVAGGPVFETAAAAASCVAAITLGHPLIAFVIATAALGLHIVYVLVFDLALTWRHGAPAGDTAVMWTISRAGALAVAVGVVVAQAGLVWVSWAALRGAT
ncbi:hypothetical protein [Rubrivirga sp.]|uniref:hypothetical protein n=1 Tax=Rubrivirga sp. TaxID=1885344 RepID=UPI003C731A71